MLLEIYFIKNLVKLTLKSFSLVSLKPHISAGTIASKKPSTCPAIILNELFGYCKKFIAYHKLVLKTRFNKIVIVEKTLQSIA